MDDLISRQAAIEALWKIKDERDSVYYTSAIHTAIDAMEHLPSAQPEIRYYGQFEIKDPILISEWHWIPVSERLPEGGHNIIFCDSKGNVCEGVYHAILGQWVGFRWNAVYHHDDVVAWMPLPKPMELEEG